MSRVFIVGAKRTAIGKFNGNLSKLSASELGAKVIDGVIKQSNIPKEAIDQILMGNVLQAGQGQNPARKASRLADIPESVPAITINDVCGSGLSSINLGASLILSGNANIVLAGGMESMSNAPYILQKARTGYRMGNGTLVDSMLKDALIDSIDDYHMGMTAENVADKYGITRYEMDDFSVKSHLKASEATQSGNFLDEIVTVEIPDNRNGSKIISTDEGIRGDSNVSKLSKLRSVFKENGSVTAGNSSSINDGASAVLLVSEKVVEEWHLSPLAELIDSSLVGLDPQLMGMGPAYAVSKLLNQNNLTIQDIDIFELNEAFASQSLACIKMLGINENKLNPNGGAIALGHPVGASGSRILTTLIYEMIAQKSKFGVASLCVGGGMGVATLLKSIQ